MALNILPVTVTDIEALQEGIGFFMDPAAAASEAAAINAATPGGPTVYSYAAQLLSSQISLAQIAMADSAYMEGATVTALSNLRLICAEHPRTVHDAVSAAASQLCSYSRLQSNGFCSAIPG